MPMGTVNRDVGDDFAAGGYINAPNAANSDADINAPTPAESIDTDDPDAPKANASVGADLHIHPRRTPAESTDTDDPRAPSATPSLSSIVQMWGCARPRWGCAGGWTWPSRCRIARR
jgi:hypothetical protein